MVKRVSGRDVLEWMELFKEGYSYKRIAAKTGWHPNTVAKYLDQVSFDPLLLYLASVFRDQPVSFEKRHRLLADLLRLEKERRGVKPDKLVFVGVRNIAEYYWCAEQSILKSRENEPEFFHAYLYDRITYSERLGLIDELPRDVEELLAVGEKISLADVEKLLKQKKDEEEGFLGGEVLAVETTDEKGRKVIVMNPDISQEDKEFLIERAAEGATIAGTEDFPPIRGEMSESTRAERYPRIRWNFSWEDYVVVGVPDGITDTFVYEYKTTRNRFLSYYIKPVALAQADLYGLFFKRDMKRVQIYIVEEDATQTITGKVDREKALETLRLFKEADEGKEAIPPVKWKCKRCKYNKTCKITQTQS